jgi:transposase
MAIFLTRSPEVLNRGWSVLRTFRDIDECRRFLAEQHEDHAIKSVTG